MRKKRGMTDSTGPVPVSTSVKDVYRYRGKGTQRLSTVFPLLGERFLWIGPDNVLILCLII